MSWVSVATHPDLHSAHEHTHIRTNRQTSKLLKRNLFQSLLTVSGVKQPCAPSDRHTHVCNTLMLPHYDAAGEPDHAKTVCEWYKKAILSASMRPGFLSVTAGNLISRDYNQSKSKEWMQSPLHEAGFLSSTMQSEQKRNGVNVHNSPGV